MKIIEKKCPNCGANLKFQSGERNARCESCRREFVVEYDTEDLIGNLKDAAKQLQAESINLVPAAKVFGTVVAIHSIVVMLISAVILVAVIFGIINAVSSFNRINERANKQTETQQTTNPLESNEEYDRAYKELMERQQQMLNNQNSGYNGD